MNKIKKSDYIWAKSIDQGNYWIPLWLHLRDTYEVSGWIWDNRMARKHKDLLMEDLSFSEKDAKSLFSLLCGLHDLGKSTPDFSGRDRVRYNTMPLYLRMQENGFSYDSYNINRKSGDDSSIRHEISSEFYIKEFLKPENSKYTQDTILAIIASHHGNPQKMDYASTTSLRDMINDAKNFTWLESLQELFDFIMNGTDNSRKILEKAMQTGITWRTQLIYSSYLSMSDWIASDVNLFPLWEFNKVEPSSWNIDNQRLEQALSRLNFPDFFDSSKINLSNSIEEKFEQRFGFSTPRDSQRALVDLIMNEDTEPSDIFILEAPMGEGKTEAALIAAEILMKRSNSTGLFFGLPTMATGEAIYQRFNPYLESLLKDSSQTSTLELMHSKAFLSKAKEKIDGKAYFNQKNHGVIANGWLSGRYLKTLNSFLVGTVDTFLMMQLKAKYGYWRHLGFSQKVIIIDEVHSMDETMKHYLIECLRMAGVYGCPVILASATLRDIERQEYIAAYIEGKILGDNNYGKNQ